MIDLLGTLVPFRRTETPPGWRQGEMAECFRVVDLLARTGLPVAIQTGLSDEGDPWAVIIREDTGDVLLHLARMDGEFLVASAAGSDAQRGRDLRAVIDAAFSQGTLGTAARQDRWGRTEGLLLHPSTMMAAVIVTALMHTEGLRARADSAAEDQAERPTADARPARAASDAPLPPAAVMKAAAAVAAVAAVFEAASLVAHRLTDEDPASLLLASADGPQERPAGEEPRDGAPPFLPEQAGTGEHHHMTAQAPGPAATAEADTTPAQDTPQEAGSLRAAASAMPVMPGDPASVTFSPALGPLQLPVLLAADVSSALHGPQDPGLVRRAAAHDAAAHPTGARDDLAGDHDAPQGPALAHAPSAAQPLGAPLALSGNVAAPPPGASAPAASHAVTPVQAVAAVQGPAPQLQGPSAAGITEPGLLGRPARLLDEQAAGLGDSLPFFRKAAQLLHLVQPAPKGDGGLLPGPDGGETGAVLAIARPITGEALPPSAVAGGLASPGEVLLASSGPHPGAAAALPAPSDTFALSPSAPLDGPRAASGPGTAGPTAPALTGAVGTPPAASGPGTAGPTAPALTGAVGTPPAAAASLSSTALEARPQTGPMSLNAQLLLEFTTGAQYATKGDAAAWRMASMADDTVSSAGKLVVFDAPWLAGKAFMLAPGVAMVEDNLLDGATRAALALKPSVTLEIGDNLSLKLIGVLEA